MASRWVCPQLVRQQLVRQQLVRRWVRLVTANRAALIHPEWVTATVRK